MDQRLSPEEQKRLHKKISSMYPECEWKDNKAVLKIIKYMNNADIYMLCYWYDSVPFQGTIPNDWKIEREGLEIKVFNKTKGHSYIIDTHNGDVNILRGGMRSHLGTAVYATQFLMEYYYAFPLFYGPGHWGNGKTPFQLGLAIPDPQPLYDALNILYDKDESFVTQWFFDKKLHKVDLTDINIFEQELTTINKQINDKR